MTTYATATIKRDHLDGTYDGKVLVWGDGAQGDNLVRDRFKLVDDDGITYYTGTLLYHDDHASTIDDPYVDAWDQLWCWGAADSGTTSLWINGKEVIS